MTDFLGSIELTPRYYLYFNFWIRLDATSLNILYPPESSKCSQCGERFAAAGKSTAKLIDDHMDWHFRLNRKAREAIYMIKSRMWLSTEAVRTNFFDHKYMNWAYQVSIC
jgi:hypothetical protein